MNRYIKLVNFEMNRFFKFYIGLLILTAISQFVSLFLVIILLCVNSVSYALFYIKIVIMFRSKLMTNYFSYSCLVTFIVLLNSELGQNNN